MRFPTELSEKAREVEPDFPMGSANYEAWLKDHPGKLGTYLGITNACEGCPHYDKCHYFSLGVLVAIGRTQEILDELKVSLGHKQGK